MNKTKILTLILSFSVIGIGALLWAFSAFLDGTWIDPVVTHNMPMVKLSDYTDFGTFQPDGSLSGAYAVTTDKTSYSPGDSIYAYISVCLHRQIQPEVQWTFVNDIAQALPPREGNLVEKGCYTNEKVKIATVPDEFRAAFANSQYHLYGNVTYTVNPFRKINYVLISNPFTIVQKP